jgi:hypothetical protein
MSKTKAQLKAELKKDEEIDRVSCERELRRYVRFDGGFKKNITEPDKKRAEEIMKLLGRKKPEWDETIIPVTGAKRPLI